jgi:hypothetical protein
MAPRTVRVSDLKQTALGLVLTIRNVRVAHVGISGERLTYRNPDGAAAGEGPAAGG